MARTWSRGTLPGVVLAALLAAAPAIGAPQSEVHESRPASADMRLEIDEIIVGNIQITGWDRDEMEVVGHLGRDVNELLIEGGSERYEIGVDTEDWDRWDDGRGRRGRDADDRNDVDVDLEIHLPRGASLDIETVTAPIHVQDVVGHIRLETVTGTIEYEGDAPSLSLETVTGDIRAAGSSLERGQFESVQGDIVWTGGIAARGRISFDTVGGSVEMRLPDGVSASFDVETTMGDIDTDFEVRTQRVSRWTRAQELHFTIGDGGAEISIETLQGDVRLRRQ